MRIECAWCHILMYTNEAVPRDQVSHGVCPTCLELYFPALLAWQPPAGTQEETP